MQASNDNMSPKFRIAAELHAVASCYNEYNRIIAAQSQDVQDCFTDVTRRMGDAIIRVHDEVENGNGAN